MKINEQNHQSVLELAVGEGEQRFLFHHPPGTFALTPASKTLIHTITQNQELLHGVGIDWGCGIGCLAIVAAKIAKVEKVVGLEISQRDIEVSFENAKANKVLAKVDFFHSDSYNPYLDKDKIVLSNLNNQVDFILANPPSSDGDDGFGFRREVLKGGKTYLKKGGKIFLNISFQYSPLRVENLVKEIEGYRNLGVLYSTDWVPFDLKRSDLLQCLKTYKAEEEKGGFDYTFKSADPTCSGNINARTAYQAYETTGEFPLTKWQTHLFERI